MKKLTFVLPEQKTLEVNGEVYTVLLNDTEVILKASEVEKKLRNLTKSATSGQITEAESDEALDILNFLTRSVDNILGEGTLMKITNGRTPSLAASIDMYRQITGAVVEIYEEDIDKKYA